MRIILFKAADGDCLLLRSENNTNILVDGGRKSAFRANTLPYLASELQEEGLDLDLVYVSHIDNDHISGPLELMQTIVEWKVFDFQRSTGNTNFREPRFRQNGDRPRPPKVNAVWHNTFSDIIGENAGPIGDMLAQAAQSFVLDPTLEEDFEDLDNLITGVNEGVELRFRLAQNLPEIVVNEPADGKLMMLTNALETATVGDFSIKILGPQPQDLEDLRVEWNTYLDEKKNIIERTKREIERDAERLGLSEEESLQRTLLAQASAFVNLGTGSITTPNLASLTLLVEEEVNGNKQTILLTGDAGSDDILNGLRAHGLIDDQTGIHVSALKVQHHGALANLTDEFLQFVTADHYLFCGNGNHHNPEIEVMEAIVDSRTGEIALESKSPNVQDPFVFWFTSSDSDPDNSATRRAYMGEIETVLDRLRRQIDRADNGLGRNHFRTRYMRRSDRSTIRL